MNASKRTNIQDIITLHPITSHDIALAAYHDGLASDYEAIQGETGYRLIHPTNPELSIVLDVETDENDEIAGWTYSTYEKDENEEWQNISTDGYGLDDKQSLNLLINDFEEVLTNWAK